VIDSNYHVEVVLAQFGTGPQPVYEVTLANGTKVTRETFRGVLRVIRMDQKARTLNRSAG
jgi:hypothetical protein